MLLSTSIHRSSLYAHPFVLFKYSKTYILEISCILCGLILKPKLKMWPLGISHYKNVFYQHAKISGI